MKSSMVRLLALTSYWHCWPAWRLLRTGRADNGTTATDGDNGPAEDVYALWKAQTTRASSSCPGLTRPKRALPAGQGGEITRPHQHKPA